MTLREANLLLCTLKFSLTFSLNHLLKPAHNHGIKDDLPLIPTVSLRFPPSTVGTEPSVFHLLLSNRELVGGYWKLMPSPPIDWVRALFSNRKERNYKPDLSDEIQLVREIWKNKLLAMAENCPADPSPPHPRPCGDQYTRKHPTYRNNTYIPSQICRMNMVIQQLTDLEHFYVNPIHGPLGPGEQQEISMRSVSLETFKIDILDQKRLTGWQFGLSVTF